MSAVAFRRHLHAYPELSFEEHATAAFIAERLAEAGIDHRPIAGTGILARIEGRPEPAGERRRAVVLRADIDALPIREATGLEYASRHEGVMHACGHDIHAAVLYGTLCALAAEPDFRGTVFGLFQPGEECNPGGASKVLAEDPFAGYDIRAVVGEHVESGMPVGTLGFRAGKYMAANDELRFTVRGTGGHGALRGAIHDPVAAAAELITGCLGLNAPGRVLSIGRVEAAGATNVIPDTVRLEGTLRTFDEEDRTAAHRRIRAIAETADRRHGTHTETDIDRGYPPVVNDAALTELAAALAAAEGLGVERLALRPTAEDFGHYGLRYPALFYRLGAGEAGRPHTETFSPDERAIGTGIDFMRKLTLKIMRQ